MKVITKDIIKFVAVVILFLSVLFIFGYILKRIAGMSI